MNYLGIRKVVLLEFFHFHYLILELCDFHLRKVALGQKDFFESDKLIINSFFTHLKEGLFGLFVLSLRQIFFALSQVFVSFVLLIRNGDDFVECVKKLVNFGLFWESLEGIDCLSSEYCVDCWN